MSDTESDITSNSMSNSMSKTPDSKDPEDKGKPLPTRERILIAAVDLFAEKGYSETTVRDIAAVVGINVASLYFHFKAKEDMLHCLIEDYLDHTRAIYTYQNITPILAEDPTAEGIVACIMASLARLENPYYRKILNVIFQEQHRSELFGEHVLQRFHDIEEFVAKIITELERLGLIRSDINTIHWQRAVSSILYASFNRETLSYNKAPEGLCIKEMKETLLYLCNTMLKVYQLPD